jgi:hypothetical protein
MSLMQREQRFRNVCWMSLERRAGEKEKEEKERKEPARRFLCEQDVQQQNILRSQFQVLGSPS